MARAFVIRPFGQKTDSAGAKIDFERVSRELIGPALERVTPKLTGGTTAEIIDAGNIREDMFALILEADLVVCDITILNANVYYELGIRHALRMKHTVLIKGGPTADDTPFDLLTDRYLPYDVEAPGSAVAKLVATIEASLASERRTDSPIFQMLAGLPEADPKHVQAVPLEFAEEVDRATAARSPGWLRLLAQDVEKLRFQWPGLRKVGAAQWTLKDYEGARRTWEAIRSNSENDAAANLALANIYERLYRSSADRSLLQASEQALERVLRGAGTTRKDRTESLALRGRNQKTLWRLEIEGLPNPDERRERAMNRALRESYESYRSAFFDDLNAFYPGVAALQMGTLQLSLSGTDAWLDAFDDDAAAALAKERLARSVEELRFIVPASVQAALDRLEPGKKDTWAEISRADVLFLTQDRPRRVIAAYRDAVPTDDPFAWDATKGQLELFESLGLKADLARQIVDDIDPRFEARAPASGGRARHLVVFGGHRPDENGRAAPRFPPHSEQLARELIQDALKGLCDDGHHVEVLVSGAPGADVLALEACKALGIEHRICLPMPVDIFSREVFQDADAWRTRFLDLVNGSTVLELSDRVGLPKWLEAAVGDPWERGNRWVLEMARSSAAEKVTLLALWDGKDAGDAPGGTAQMVQLARDAGTVAVEIIDAGRLTTGIA